MTTRRWERQRRSGAGAAVDLAPRPLTYEGVGATRPGDPSWTHQVPGFRRFERSVRIGHGTDHWEAASAALLRWGVKTRSGFRVEPLQRVRIGADSWLVARLGPLAVREPVRVVAVVDEPARRGFAYGTLSGHPVSGEGAFVVHRTPAGDVWLMLRSLTRPSEGLWRLAFPALLVAQRWYRARYLRALVQRRHGWKWPGPNGVQKTARSASAGP